MTVAEAVSAGSTAPSVATIALVGQPNVGKSALFHHLTGIYATVANYPGTTVEIARAAARALPGAFVVDTPGIIAWPGQSEDEILTSRILLEERLGAVVQVGDAKNPRRTLLLTVPLAETGLPLVLAMNMSDEAKARRVAIDPSGIAERLGLPVIPTVAIDGNGVDALVRAMAGARPTTLRVAYPEPIEDELERLAVELPVAAVSPRALGLLWLQEDPAATAWISAHLDTETLRKLEENRNALQATLEDPLAEIIHRARLALVEDILGPAPGLGAVGPDGFAAWLGRLCLHPVWGVGILALILLGVYLFVGVVGAQILVGWLEERLFGELLNPLVNDLVAGMSLGPFVTALLVGPYGLWTMGLTYAVALILPIVSTFFFAFGLMEDSGYLPRLAVLTHNAFRRIGLNGKAVLPMVLGLGCVTTATVTTRILESRRDRLLATVLLALAVPCSAQLGIVLGVLAGISFSASVIWAAVVLGLLFSVGWLAAQLVPGERTPLLLEIPPLRPPRVRNTIVKTGARLDWYMREVVPFFLLGALIVFLLDWVGWLNGLARLSEPLVTSWLGLPPEAGLAFLLGFLRRDFGAAGLFAMASGGQLSDVQALVGMVTITLFIPCLAAVMMIARERGWRNAIAISALVIPLAFAVGGVLRLILLALGWGS